MAASPSCARPARSAHLEAAGGRPMMHHHRPSMSYRHLGDWLRMVIGGRRVAETYNGAMAVRRARRWREMGALRWRGI